ncbi:MAG: RagB/SusD family nutrient uptake outer membrane protein [Prevotella sp.]|nr:RagB/SusD family nutrient uptake outer membrane protein [Prevotella sp.]
MKKYLYILICASMMMVSCVDTVILPDDKTVDEDFWQTKSDVSLMVEGAYKSMVSSDVISRLIVWGDFRSDELLPVSSISSNATVNALNEIDAQNTQTDNTFASWASLYSVINNCNIVLDRAEGVMSIDPSYTEGDYQTDRSQMLALRALCYFYLVRNFRDIPYNAHAYMTSSEEMNIPQSSPDIVLQNCINDLEEAGKNALDPTAFSDWRRVGHINRDAVNAILADIYLWRASVMHSDADYQKCIEYCDKVIESKRLQHIPGRNEVEVKEYPLADGTQAFTSIFINQNAEESIFELQFDGRNNSNAALCQFFYKYRNTNSPNGYMKASTIFGNVGNGAAVYTQTGDYRYLQNCYAVGTGADAYDIRKMVTQMEWNINNPVGMTGQSRQTDRPYDNFAQNYIFYRLSDVMLMKAEAETAVAADNNDPHLRDAFNLVQFVNSRSIYNGSLGNDSLKWSYYNTKIAMETLVLQERLRELCFEGKRWYDLLRYNFRHVEGVDYTTILAAQEEAGKTFVRNDANMLNWATRKYTSGAAAAASKMRTEPYLYMPINQSDIDVNPLLRQNPAYSDADEYKKNY